MKARIQHLIAEYGTLAVLTYLTIFALVLGGFVTAISLGFEVDDAAAGAGTLAAAWFATKLTQPLRIAATIALTPAVAAVVHKVRPRSG